MLVNEAMSSDVKVASPDQSIRDAAQLIGGSWLGSWMTLGAMVTNVAILNGTVLACTRMPFAMAEDGYLPSVFTRLHPRFGGVPGGLGSSNGALAPLVRNLADLQGIGEREESHFATLMAAVAPAPVARVPFLAEEVLPVVPAPVLAEAWRGGPRQASLSRLLALCDVAPMSEGQARGG